MELGFTSITATLFAIYFLVKSVSFLRFYINGRRTGFPVYVTPVPSKSPLWMILGPVFQPQFKKYLPEWIYERLDIVTHGWEFRRKTEFHDRFGKVFAVVTPDECSLW
jgi:hypothetical protein